MNTAIYRVFPLNEHFELNGVFLPSLDVYADDKDSALRAAERLFPSQPVGFISIMVLNGNWKAAPYL